MIRRMEDLTAQEKEKADVDSEMRFLWSMLAVEMGMLGALAVICHLVGLFTRDSARPAATRTLDVMQIIFVVAGLLSLALAHWLRRAYLGGRFKQHDDTCAQVAVLRNVEPYIAKYRSGVFHPMLIPGTLGIYGLVLFILGGGYATFYAFIIVSALAVIWQRPKKSELIALGQGQKPDAAEQKTEPEA